MNERYVRKKQLLNQASQHDLEVEWSKYKYWTMARSQKLYNNLRLLFKGDEKILASDFYEYIDNAETLPENKRSEINAFEHVWGYFKNIAAKEERMKFLKTLDNYRNDTANKPEVYKILYNMATKYKREYLLQSYYFDDYKNDA